MVEELLPKNQERTAVVYFGPQREDYFRLAAAEGRREFLSFIQQPLQVQLGAEKHRAGSGNTSRYTGHGQRERYVQGWLGERVRIPICRCAGFVIQMGRGQL